jgi:hypothetical protein
MSRTLLALLLIAIPVLSAGQSDRRVVKPEIRVGDSWTYRSTNIFGPGTHEHEDRVSFTNDKVILLVSTSKSDGKEADSSWTTDWNAVTSIGGLMYRPNAGIFRFPLRIGDKHDVRYEQLRPRVTAAENSTIGSVKVTGWETVEVPAGKFRAIKVEVESTVRPSGGSRAYPRDLTYWYVPDVRRWVKDQGVTPRNKFSSELLEYKLNEN